MKIKEGDTFISNVTQSIYMKSRQLNIRTSLAIMNELDAVVNQGLFRSRSEAVNEAIRLLIRRYKIMKIAERIDQIAREDLGEGCLTDALLESRYEEDK